MKQIEYMAFSGSGLTSIQLPEGVEELDFGCFKDCLSLKEVSFPSTLRKMGSEVFSGCTALTTVSFPDACNLGNIGISGFTKCTALRDFTVPSSVLSLDDYAFSASTLTNITIPASVTTIGEGCFANCRRLATVTDLAPQPQTILPSVFSGVSLPQLTLRVPLSATSNYQGAAVWSGFGQIVGI